MNAIVTLCTKEANALGEITHPLLKSYADRVGADFIVISDPKINLGNHNFEKFQIYELFEKYERIIYIDTDTIVTPQCPNLFEIVPEEQFGAFLVSEYTYFHDGAIKRIQDKLGTIDWKRAYFNAGVMVISKHHREAFSKEHGLLEWATEKGAFYDQTLLNYTLQKLKIPIYKLSYKFNHTTETKNSKARFGRRINQLINIGNGLVGAIFPKYKQHQEYILTTKERYIVYSKDQEPIKHRFTSYIIHYTGKGHRLEGNKLQQIQKDLSLINNQPLARAIAVFPLIGRVFK